MLPRLAVLLLLLPGAAHADESGFSIQNVSVGSGADAVRVSVLRNHATGESVDILTSFGGKLERVFLAGMEVAPGWSRKGDPRDIIASRCNGTYGNCTSALLKDQAALALNVAVILT